MVFRNFLCFMLYCIPLLGISQEYIDLAVISYSTTPKNEFDNTLYSTNISELGLQLNIPIVINEKTALLTGFSGNKTQLIIDTTDQNNTNLYSLGIPMGWHSDYSSKWSATYLLIPKLSTDLENSFKQGFQLGAVVLLSRKKSNNFIYKYGLYLNTEKYGTLIVPLVGAYYTSPTGFFEADILLPNMMDVNYKLNSKTWTGLVFNSWASSFALHNTNFPESYITKTSNELFAYVRRKIVSNLYLDFKIGYSFFRSYKVFNAQDKVQFSLAGLYVGNNRTELNHTFDDGLIFKVELRYRIHFETSK